jgi:dienelactone hydrolase
MDIRPGPEARRGAAWALIATAAIVAFIGGYYLDSGFGVGVDLAFAFGIAALGIPLAAVVVALLLTILRKLPRLASGFILGACLFIAFPWPPQLGLPLAAVIGIVEGFFGAAIATLISGNFRMAALSKKVVTIVLLAGATAANIGIVIFFARSGTDADVLKFQSNVLPAPPPLSASNPALPGPYAVKLLFYGSGTDMRRPEYGKPVAIKTATVDASRFFKDFKGWKASLRRRYWGFGMDKLPLNARVWYPDGPGPFPLALIVHGNHNMAEFSDPGYEYLGRLLASRGFILASIDENFLNSGLFHDPPKQQAVRGWMLLEHLRLWREWNGKPGNPFYGKVDVNNVALMGHSRGGEAAATAALFNKLRYYPDDAKIHFDYGYPIKSIVAIAPADGQYKPAGQWRLLENVNYLTVQGANDADVSTFMGSRQFDHVRFTEQGPWFKAELYIYRANHGQFNTVWGRSDAGEPLGAFLNLKPLMKAEDQRRIAAIYISAFLEATLHDRREYVPLFRDYRTIRAWLPDTYYMSRYFDASYETVAGYNEDPDVTTTTAPGGRIDAENLTVWREGRIPRRQGDRDYNGVFLGWNRGDEEKKPAPTPVYTLTLPPGTDNAWKLGADSALTISAAVTDETAPLPGSDSRDQDKSKKKDAKPEPVDFTVELQTANGATARLPLSRFGLLPPPFKVRFTKLALMDDFAYNKASEPIFQTVELPLAAFAAQTPGFDPAAVKTIRFRFDRTRSSVIIVSQVGFERR